MNLNICQKVSKRMNKIHDQNSPKNPFTQDISHPRPEKPNFRISLPDPSLKSHQTTTTATKTQKCYFPFLAGNQSDRQARAT